MLLLFYLSVCLLCRIEFIYTMVFTQWASLILFWWRHPMRAGFLLLLLLLLFISEVRFESILAKRSSSIPCRHGSEGSREGSRGRRRSIGRRRADIEQDWDIGLRGWSSEWMKRYIVWRRRLCSARSLCIRGWSGGII